LREQHDYIFQPVQPRGGLHGDNLECSSRLCGFDGANQQVLGENAVFARGNDDISGLKFFVVDHVLHVRLGIAAASDDAMRAGNGKKSAHAAVLIVDEEDLRGGRKDLDDFSYHSIRCNHSHITTQTIVFAAIDEERVRCRIGACANHLRGEHSCFGMRVVKIQQRGDTLSLDRAALKLTVPEAKLVQFASQTLILGARVAQADIAAPDTTDVRKCPRSSALERSHQLHCPIADQPDIVFPFDLKREQKHLRKDDDCEQTQRAMA
jgi:hypothetical protein